MKLEQLVPDAVIRGILPGEEVTVVAARWAGSRSMVVTYRTAAGRVDEQVVYRDQEDSLQRIEQTGRAWSFTADASLFRLVAEARRIRLAYLFDDRLAVHLSLVEPLPHQITAVNSEMLPRQPLRFYLADDPGAGKTIMAGLYIMELMLRGDLQRCLVVAPGGLVAQWQDELFEKFGLYPRLRTSQGAQADVLAIPARQRRTGPPRAARRPPRRPEHWPALPGRAGGKPRLRRRDGRVRGSRMA